MIGKSTFARQTSLDKSESIARKPGRISEHYGKCFHAFLSGTGSMVGDGLRSAAGGMVHEKLLAAVGSTLCWSGSRDLSMAPLRAQHRTSRIDDAPGAVQPRSVGTDRYGWRGRRSARAWWLAVGAFAILPR